MITFKTNLDINGLTISNPISFLHLKNNKNVDIRLEFIEKIIQIIEQGEICGTVPIVTEPLPDSGCYGIKIKTDVIEFDYHPQTPAFLEREEFSKAIPQIKMWIKKCKSL